MALALQVNPVCLVMQALVLERPCSLIFGMAFEHCDTAWKLEHGTTSNKRSAAVIGSILSLYTSEGMDSFHLLSTVVRSGRPGSDRPGPPGPAQPSVAGQAGGGAGHCGTVTRY